MADTKVQTIAGLAQWKIESFGPRSPYKISDPFKMGIWKWHLSVEKNRAVYIRLFLAPSWVSRELLPHARFVIRVSTSPSNRRSYVSPIHERLLRSSDDFACPVDIYFQGRFVIDVEFLDLKICPINGGEGRSIWPSDGVMQSQASQNTIRCLSRMLDDSIHADVTINSSDGSLQAHKAILSASSPVFLSMFQHDLKEKKSSTIDIEDMTYESCTALLSYLYGTISQEDFLKHWLALLSAANKYDIVDLKDTCEESLLEDINSGNVLARLQEAWLYQLDKLKKACFTYLLDFPCPVYINFQGRFVFDVEAMDLKICRINGICQNTLRCLSRMLDDSIHADVTINSSDGSLQAHKAILSASSPVFLSMFQHDLKEKKSSTIDIEDMTYESCTALLSYLYGTISQEDFWKHRLALLSAANKYDIVDLKDTCEESLLEDINSGNVLARLQEAWLYQLDKLKKACWTYLLDFGKIYDVGEDMNDFFRHGHRDLVVEMLQELLAVCKPT